MTLINNKRAVGVFSSHEEVENALSELRDNGFDMNQVSVIAKHPEDLNQQYRIGETRVQEPTETHEISHETKVETTHVEEGTKTGIEAGGAVGGLTGLLIGLGTLAIPGMGPIMLAGAAATAIATTLAGGAIGAAVGGLIGGLVGLGIPEHRAQVYHDYVVDGDYLVIVDGTEAEILRAETIFKHTGMREWEVYESPTITRHVAPVASRV
jgi:tetrahydromethanopterin S-methyltransferase subunit G